jgi:hypothetical protein
MIRETLDEETVGYVDLKKASIKLGLIWANSSMYKKWMVKPIPEVLVVVFAKTLHPLSKRIDMTLFTIIPGFKKNGSPLIIDLILSINSSAVSPTLARIIAFLSWLKSRYQTRIMEDVIDLPTCLGARKILNLLP